MQMLNGLGRTRALGLVGAVGFVGVWAGATPIQLPGSKGPTQFRDGTTITVYIPDDPNKLGRDADLAAGILAWNGERPLISHHIQIQVKNGQAPPNTPNAVQVNWQAPTTGTELGEATTEYAPGKNGNTTTGGTIDIDPNVQDVNNNEAKNLGIHEMGHILGIDDALVGTSGAMDPNFNKNQKISITDGDTLELFSTFASTFSPTSGSVTSKVGFNNGLYEYDYTLNWLAGVDNAMALFQVDTNGADIENIVAPTGWAVDSPIGSDVSVLAVGGEGTESFVSFVLRDEMSYLGPNHPQLEFSFDSSVGPGGVGAFLNGEVGTTGPVPEPGSFWLAGCGLIALLLLMRRLAVAR